MKIKWFVVGGGVAASTGEKHQWSNRWEHAWSSSTDTLKSAGNWGYITGNTALTKICSKYRESI